MNKIFNAPPSPAAFLMTLEDLGRDHRPETRRFIETHHALIMQGVQDGYASAQIFRAFHRLGLPPPMSERQFRRYVSLIKREPPADVATRHSPAPPMRQAPPATLEHGPDAPAAERSKRPPVFQPTTFDWHPEVDLDDIS